MYIPSFLQSLEQLKGLKVPDFLEFESLDGKVIYYNYVNKDKIKDSSFNDTGTTFIAFSEISNPDKIRYINVDKYIDYINSLDKESFKVKQGKIITLEAALYEAIWLFDEFSKIKRSEHPFVDMDMYDGVYVIDLINKQYLPSSDQSTLSFFRGNPVKKDVFVAQFNYFIKKYLIAKLNTTLTEKSNLRTPSQFNQKLFNAVNQYIKSLDDIENQKWRNNIIDSEFDNFIQQLNDLYIEDTSLKKQEAQSLNLFEFNNG
ncbi:MAG: hypothetical protein RR500_02985 [Bacilli bacterium]